MKGVMAFEHDPNLKETDLGLGLPGTHESEKDVVSNTMNNKRALSELIQDSGSKGNSDAKQETAPASKAQIVGWPPVRSYRKNNLQMKKTEAETGIYLKLSMDGVLYLRKIDMNVYNEYPELLKALEIILKFTIGDYSEREGYKGSEYAPTYEDKDGDLMIVGDVPWEMFISSCKRLRIIKGSEARGLGCGM